MSTSCKIGGRQGDDENMLMASLGLIYMTMSTEYDARALCAPRADKPCLMFKTLFKLQFLPKHAIL